ncbi:MAG: hypothetical protein R2795_05545 [Saprospiraceae bacterium]
MDTDNDDCRATRSVTALTDCGPVCDLSITNVSTSCAEQDGYYTISFVVNNRF